VCGTLRSPRTPCPREPGHSREVVVIVLGDEVRHVHDPHRLVQARVKRRRTEPLFVPGLESRHELRALCSEFREDFVERPRVVIRLAGPPVLHVRRPQDAGPAFVVVESSEVEFIQVQEMPGVFLD